MGVGDDLVWGAWTLVGEKWSLLHGVFFSLLCRFPGRFVGDTHTVLSEVKLNLCMVSGK